MVEPREGVALAEAAMPLYLVWKWMVRMGWVRWGRIGEERGKEDEQVFHQDVESVASAFCFEDSLKHGRHFGGFDRLQDFGDGL